ncbi:GLPGLI family protein [Nonlabens antarcticus]|uniref:GLPGLI family protein n=1 Tax=Nonlabens antarcticus TaxID=392714 RepID=UPI0018912C8E|nr:GLPGLI family protein [Nonlabens antarcticus]
MIGKTLILYAATLFCCSSLSAQQVLKVEYYYENNFYSNHEILYVKNNEAVYIKPPIHKKEEVNVEEKEGNHFVITGGDIKTKNIIYFLNATNKSSTAYTISNDQKRFLVEDKNLNLDWKIRTEFKQIGDYKCQVATLNFRGRDFTAFFTDQIPVSYGPFKFMGLPGLILELSTESSDSYHTWIAKKISNKREDLMLPSIADYEVPVITLKEFEELREEFMENRNKASAARLPQGTTQTSSVTTRLGIERVFEWEK